MGRFIVTNDKEKHAYAEKTFLEGGLAKNERFFFGTVNVTAFRKVLETANENSVAFENGDFMAVIGTFIYNRKTGTAAIKELYAVFDGDVAGLKERMFGNYSCVVKKNGRLYVFPDALGLQKIYYANGPGEIIISEDITKVAMLLDKASVNRLALIEQSFQYSNLGKESVFKEISCLEGHEYAEIVDGKMSIRKNRQFRSEKKIQRKDCQTMVQELCEMIKEDARKISEVFPDVRINLTGGVDSRLMLAAFMAIGIKPTIMHGKGDSRLTNTFKEDLEVTKRIAKRFKLPVRIMDWSLGNIMDDERGLLISRYGQYYMSYFARLMGYYEESYTKRTIVLDGLVGEQFRNIEWVDKHKGDTYDFDTFISNYLYYDPRSYVIRHKEYFAYVRRKNLKIVRENGIDPRRMKKDDFQRLNNYYRIKSTPLAANLMNAHLNTLNFLFSPKVFNYLMQVPAEYKRKANFQLRVMGCLCQGLLEMPFFSHCRWMDIDKEAFELKPKFNLLLLVKGKIPKWLAEGHLRKLYAALVMGRKDRRQYAEIAKDIRGMQEKLGLKLIRPNKGVYLPTLQYYLEYLKLIEYVDARRYVCTKGGA